MNTISKNIAIQYFLYFLLIVAYTLVIKNYARDFTSYENLHTHSNIYDLTRIFKDFYYEPAFLIIFYYLSKALPFYELFFLLSFITMTIKLVLFKRFNQNYFLAIFLYVFLGFFSLYEASQIRTAIGITFILYAIISKNKNFLFYLGLTLLGLCFHKVAILILPLYSIRFSLFGCVAIFFLFLFQDPLINFLVANFDSHNFKIIDSLRAYHTPGYAAKTFDAFLIPASLTNSFFWSMFFIILITSFNFKELNSIQKKSFLFMVVSCFLYIAFIGTANIASRFLEAGMVGLIPLVCAQKLSWDMKWLFVYGLMGYIICYQTTLISILVLENRLFGYQG